MTNFLTLAAQYKGNHAMTGQHLAEWETVPGFKNLVLGPTGFTPLIISRAPLTGLDDQDIQMEAHLEYLSTHREAGGVVTLAPHFANPWVNTAGKRILSTAWVTDQSIGKPDLNLLTFGTPGTVSQNFVAQVDRLIVWINRLRGTDPVVVRLFHEANGRHFWWGWDGTTGREDKLKALWLRTAQYIEARVNKPVTWCHSGAANVHFRTDITANSTQNYGPLKFGLNTWIKVRGADIYKDDLSFYSEDLAEFNTWMKTPGNFGMWAEVGPLESTATGNWPFNKVPLTLAANHPSIVAWVAWADYNGHHLQPSSNPAPRDAFTNPWSVNLNSNTVPTPVPTDDTKYYIVRSEVLGPFTSVEELRSEYPEVTDGEIYVF